MSKRTTLQLLNLTLSKCNEPQVTSFVGVVDGTRTFQIYGRLNEALGFIYNQNKGKWRFAEAIGTGTFATGTNQYAVPSDVNFEMLRSFKIGNDHVKKAINYKDQEQFENDYPYIDPSVDTGWPNYFTKYNNYYVFDLYAGTTQNTHYFNFRYWKFESSVSTSSASTTATATGATPTYTTTVLIPEQFEEMLTDLAALFQFDFEGDAEANSLRLKIFGNQRDIRGSLNEMKDLQNSVEKLTVPVDIIL